MSSWTSQEWIAVLVAVIGALSAGISSIISNFQNRHMLEKLDRHEARSQHRADGRTDQKEKKP